LADASCALRGTPRAVVGRDYGGVIVNATCFAKERTRLAHDAVGLIGRLSLHEHDAAHPDFKFHVDPTTESITVFMDVAPRRLSRWTRRRRARWT
jgi:hypothetical protein